MRKKWCTKSTSVVFGRFFYLPSQETVAAFVVRLSAIAIQGKKNGELEPCRRFRINQSVLW